VVKIFLHISHKEQKLRFEERLASREKQWKFDPADLDKRKRWIAYRQAFETALGRCSTPHAPWYAIPADRKWFRDLAVSQILRQELESLPLEWPKPSFDPTKIRVV
jgi:polyphosphate kinase 2 (PPK2 family)